MPINRTINTLSGWRLWALWLLGFLLKLSCRTLRIDVDPLSLKAAKGHSQPTVFLCWHNRLLLAAAGYKRFCSNKKIFGLISASRDGAWLVPFFESLGIGAIRGSSSFNGSQAFQELLMRLKAGFDVALTPDGPRGPKYQLKAGALRLLEKSNAPFVMVSGNASACWRLKSWDGFILPKPFSKVTLRCVRYESLAHFLALQPLAAAGTPLPSHEALQAALRELTED